MSFQAMTWAVEQDLKTNEKMVLVMLSNCSNHHTGQCNPSHKRLAKECGMSVSTLKRCIEKLEETGYLKIERRGQDGVSLPNQYNLNIGFTPEKKPEQVDSSCNQSDQSEPTLVQSEPTHLGQNELGVGSERATNHELKQEYNNQEYNQYSEGVLPSVLPKQKQAEQSKNAELGDLPDWVPVEPWIAFVEMRKAMGSRAKLTPHAAKLIVGKLDEFRKQGMDLTEILNNSIMNNWKSVFPLKQQQYAGKQQALEDRNRAAADIFARGDW